MYIYKILAGISIVFTLCACSTKPNVVEISDRTTDSTRVAIFVVNHGWHTGIIISASDLQKQLPALKERFKGASYLEIGWGDQGFYQAEEITTGITLKAILWPTATVVHVVAFPENIQDHFSNINSVCVPKNGYVSLVTFLNKSFARDEQNQIMPLEKGIYGDSQFYRGTGSYHLFNTCNKWTAKGLKSAGFDISPSLKLTAESITQYLTTSIDTTLQCK